ncbi:hypothetical protein LSUE1_G005479, partial [Lachnellula suecica]
MSLSIYAITVPPFIKQLKMLSTILEKAEAKSAGNEASILEARLIADMQPLTYQIQRVSDSAKGLAVRVAKVEPQAWEDNEKTFAELQERIKKTIAFLEKVDPKSMDGMEDKEVTMTTGSGELKFTGKSYVLGFAIPNFYFHTVTTYNLLRKEGVEIGSSHHSNYPTNTNPLGNYSFGHYETWPAFGLELDLFAPGETLLEEQFAFTNDFFAGVSGTEPGDWMNAESEYVANGFGTSAAEYTSLEHSFGYNAHASGNILFPQPEALIADRSQLDGYAKPPKNSSATHQSP